MLTEFGRALRKLRLDESEILRDMAVKLGISTAYLSAIENGKRPIPRGFIDSISDAYTLGDDERKELKRAIDKSLVDIEIDLEGKQGARREAALIFARSFDDMDDNTAQKIIEMLKRNTHDSD